MSGPARFRGAVRLLRPWNCLLTAVSVLVGALTAGGLAGARPLVAAAGAAAIAAAGNAMNDVIDLPIDRRNRPARPLPAGDLAVDAALILAALLGALGVLLAFVAGIGCGLIAAAITVGLGLYNWFLKRSGVPGNLLVALIAAATFPYGAAAVGAAPGWGRSWIPAAFAAVYHLARELVKGGEDVDGDALAGVRTLARRRGRRFADRSAALLLAGVAVAAPLPAVYGVYGTGYLAAVLVLDVFLLDAIRRLWSTPAVDGPRPSRRLLVGMALGLAAVVLGECLDRV